MKQRPAGRRPLAALAVLAGALLLLGPARAAEDGRVPERPFPRISIEDVAVDPSAKVALVTVSLDAPPLNTVWFRVLTRNGTALEGSSFARVDEYLSIRPGEPQSRQVAVPLRPGAKDGSFFELTFPDTPEGAPAPQKRVARIELRSGAPAQKELPFRSRPDRRPQKGEPVFSLDPKAFRARDGGGRGVWDTALSHGRAQPGNGEPVVYADAELMKGIRPPWEVKDGVLVQRVQDFGKPTPSPYQGEKPQPYGASVLRANFLSQTYGYYEWDVKLPSMKGSWPGIWLLPSNRAWPPEIDVLETWNGQGYGRAEFRATNHWGTQAAHRSMGAKVNLARALGDRDFDWWSQFHAIGVDWRADYTTWFVDGKEVWSAPTRMHQPAYPLSDVTIFGGKPAPDFASGPGELQIRAFGVWK